MIWSFLLGIAVGLLGPHVWLYAKTVDLFYSAMRRKEKRIHKLMLEKNKLEKELKSRL